MSAAPLVKVITGNGLAQKGDKPLSDPRKVVSDLRRHMASLGHNKLKEDRFIVREIGYAW